MSKPFLQVGKGKYVPSRNLRDEVIAVRKETVIRVQADPQWEHWHASGIMLC